MTALSRGSTLGHYELLVRIGRGGMASVWVARELLSHPGQQRLVAVKAMLPELAGYADFRAMFLEEGLIVRSIDHAHVVRVYDVGEDRGILYMAMEWVEGDSLRAVIQEARRRRPIPPEMAVKIIADAASGLHAAHELRGWDGELRNVVHCDVSPHNLLLGLDGRAKVVDFGVANARLHIDFAENDKIKGKFGYMSPEQAGGKSLDRRSDVFALGIVLYELTTGERLFRGETHAETLQLVSSAPIPDPRRVQADYPERLVPIVLRALERDPARRFQSAEELREALERFLVEERVVVSHGSVAQLTRRVLGERIDKLRRELREVQGTRAPGASPSTGAELLPDLASLSSLPSLPTPPNSPGSVISTSTRAQTYETPGTQRARYAPLLAALCGIAAAVSSIFWLMNRPVTLQAVSAIGAASAAPIGAGPIGEGAEFERGPAGVDISSLPMGKAAGGSGRAASRPVIARVARAGKRDANPPREDDKAIAASGPEVVQLEEEPTATASSGPGVMPSSGAAQTPAADPAAGPKAAFNRGAAMAQLGSAAGRASSCKRPANPSGSGRVQVTFSPEGAPSRVTLAPPFAGTSTGACVTASFGTTRVPPFTGSSVTLPWGFRIPE